MNEGDCLADLAREADARFLCQHEVGTDGSLEQLAAVHSAQNTLTTYIYLQPAELELC